jgi:hypothetical protein
MNPGLSARANLRHGEVPPRSPTLWEIWVELVDSIAFWRDSSRLLPAVAAITW